MDTKATVAHLLVELRRLSGERRLSEWVADVESRLPLAGPELARELQGLLDLGRWYAESSQGRFAEGLPEAVRTIERIRGWQIEPPIDWLLSIAGFAMGVAGRLEQGLQWVFAAREMAQACRDETNLLSVLTSQGALYSLSGDYPSAEKVFNEAASVGPAAGLHRIILLNNQSFSLTCWARSLPTGDARCADIASRALRCADEAMAITPNEYGDQWRAWNQANRSHALALLGRTQEAEGSYLAAIAAAKANLRVELTAMAGYARLLTDARRYPEARALLVNAYDKAPSDLLDMTMDLILEAWVHLEAKAGRAEEVSRWSERRLRRIEEQYRARLGNVVRQAQLMKSIERERSLERQQAEAALIASRAKVREALLQDLHDGFGSNLATARIRAARGELTPAGLVEILDECISDLYLVVDSIGNTEGNLGEALRLLRNRLEGRLFGESTKLAWSIELDSLAPLGHERMIQVLRIVQEALANAFKHSHASSVWVDANLGDSGVLCLRVRDDGVGMRGTPTQGNGLKGMLSRAVGLKGDLQIASGNRGATVQLTVPV